MMAIKGVQNGKAIPMSAQECLNKAVIIACSRHLSGDFLYWANEETVNAKTFDVQATDKPGGWVAQASGTVMVGKTKKSNDHPKEYNFTITYRNGNDSLGLPTIKLDKFDISQDAKVNVGAPAADPAAEEAFVDLE
jgi:hypothetical protein